MNVHLDALRISWGTFIATWALLIALLFLRRLLPASKQRVGRAPILFFVLAILCQLAGGITHSAHAHGAGGILDFLSIFLVALGITGLSGVLLFELALGRLGVAVPSILRDIIQAVAFAIVILAILSHGGVNLLSLITASTVLTAVIGLALQSTIANLFAGLSLQVDRTLNIGDWVQVGSRVGRITQVKWRSTFLTTRDGEHVIVPNSVVLNGEVLNYSTGGSHRHTLKVGFAYRHPPNDVKRVLLEAVRGIPGILADPAPDCYPDEFGDSAVVYALRWWIHDVEREASIEGEIRTRIWYAANRHGLEIPYPRRDVYMTEVTQDQLTRERERDFLERVAALAQIEMFAPLESSDRELLARDMRRVGFASGEQIIRQGDPGDSLYLIHDGEVAVRLSVEGAEREVATLKNGQFFGEMSLMTGEPRRATCAAKSDVACYVIDHAAFKHLLDVRPKVLEDITSILGERQMALEGERDNLSAEARARRAAETSSRLLNRIRDFFHLG